MSLVSSSATVLLPLLIQNPILVGHPAEEVVDEGPHGLQKVLLYRRLHLLQELLAVRVDEEIQCRF